MITCGGGSSLARKSISSLARSNVYAKPALRNARSMSSASVSRSSSRRMRTTSRPISPVTAPSTGRNGACAPPSAPVFPGVIRGLRSVMLQIHRRPGKLFFGADQSVPDGKTDQPGHVMDVEPFHELRTMGFNGLYAEVELARNLLRAAAFCDELQDLALPSGQQHQGLVALTHTLHVAIDHLPRYRRAEIGFSTGNGLQRESQLERRRILDEVA